MRRDACILAVLLGILLPLSSCGTKSISPDELRSDVTSALSLAADADTSLRLFREGRLPPAFIAGHIANLSEEAQRASQELQPAPSGGARIASQARECQRDLDSLVAALLLARQHFGDAQGLADAGDRIAATRSALESLAATQ